MRRVLTISLLIVVLAVVGLLSACSDGSDTAVVVEQPQERQHYENEIVFAKEMDGWTKPSDGYVINIIIMRDLFYNEVTAYKVENGTLYFIMESETYGTFIGITAVGNALIKIVEKN